MRLIKQIWAIALLAWILPITVTHAALTIGFFNNGASNTLDVNVGDTFDLPVYLLESTPHTVLSDSGLISMGVKASFSTAGLEVTGIDINSDFDFFPMSDFDNVNGELEFSGGTLVPVVGSPLLLATVTMKQKAAGTTDVVFSHTFSGFDEFVAADGLGTVLDTEIFGPDLLGQYTASINGLSAVPEPSSGLMVSLAALYGCVCVRQRRRSRNFSAC